MVSCDLQSLSMVYICNMSLLLLVKLQPAKPSMHPRPPTNKLCMACADLPVSAASVRAGGPGICTFLPQQGCKRLSASCSDPSWLQFGSWAPKNQCMYLHLQPGTGPGSCQGRWSSGSAGAGASRRLLRGCCWEAGQGPQACAGAANPPATPPSWSGSEGRLQAGPRSAHSQSGIQAPGLWQVRCLQLTESAGWGARCSLLSF